jgi:hypothetical protein
MKARTTCKQVRTFSWSRRIVGSNPQLGHNWSQGVDLPARDPRAHRQ